ncbi:MAG TPA: ComEC/Rec2 family competence protein [Pyrinomonadaceae bacterium]|jgi:competence protein ComEC|nr:ComEC/Rec2 family competence protein [Pyrinomonadaceae bacterium]
MKRSTRGCGCAIAVLVLLLGAGTFAVIKWGLPWLRTRPPKPTGELQIHVLDVGPIEGDSILIIAPGGKSVLIDAGDAAKGKVVLDALKRYKVERLDYFIATHPHPDHIGGADEVLNGIKVGTVIDNGVDLSTPVPSPTPAKKGSKPPPLPAATPAKKRAKTITSFFDEYKDALQKSGAQYQKAKFGQKIDLGGGAILTVLAPSEPLFTKEQMKTGGNEPNANSIVLRLDYGDFSMLFMGDAEAQTEQRLLGKDVELKAYVIKIAHHGSKYATSQDFLNRVKPESAIISTGAWNRYGHPAQAVLDRLKTAGTKVYRTDLQGEITITTKGKADSAKFYEIKSAKETTEDVWLGREGQKDDSSRSGFIAYGDFGPPPKPKKTGK